MTVIGMVPGLLWLLVLSPCLRGHVPIYPDDPYSQEMSEPGFKPEEEPYTDLTTDELISQAYQRSGVQPTPMSSDPNDLNGAVLAEMDMKLTAAQFETLYGTTASPSGTKTKRKAWRPEESRWTNGTMLYEMVQADFTRSEVYKIKEAMQTWEDRTCIKFKPATSSDKNRVRFQDGVGCSSGLGMVGGLQYLTLSRKGCRYRGLYLHEIGHAIGLVHEHQLPQRDKYIDVFPEYAKPGTKVWFDKYKVDQLNQFGVEYEYNSVMHYGVHAFSVDKRYKTIRAKDRSKEKLIGRVSWKGLAFSDVKVVNLMYKCNKHCSPDPKCKEPGYLDKNCACICPLGMDCGYGIKECKDRNTETGKCAAMAKSRKCQNDPEWMFVNCQKTCEMCPPVPRIGNFTNPPTPTPTPTVPETTTALPCINKAGDAKCGRLVKRGDCKDRDGKWWMRKNCQKACDVCPGTCVDMTRHCERLASHGICGRNPESMRKKCFKTCEMCGKKQTSECRDKTVDCIGWARAGYCYTSKRTSIDCPKACGFCIDNS